MKTGEVAKLLHVSSQTVRDWTEQGKLEAHISDGGHRKYFEADVKRLMLEEKGTVSFFQIGQTVGMDRNGKFHFINDDYELSDLKPYVSRISFRKYWDYNNGLQILAHLAVLNDEPTIIEPHMRSAYICEAGEETMVCTTACVVGLDSAAGLTEITEAIEQVKRYLEDNFTAKVAYHWYDSRGHLVSP